MAGDSAYDGKVRLYALANPGDFLAEREAVERAVCEALQIAPAKNHRVRLSQSAWLDYTAVDELWDRRAPPAVPRDAATARVAAEELIARLQRTCSAANPRWPKRLRGMSLLPPANLLRRAGLHAVPRPDGSGWDHWLYRAQPVLHLDGGMRTRTDVFGAHLEIRIGHGGKVISVHSRWRPLSGEQHFTDLSEFRPAGHSHGHDEGDGHAHGEGDGHAHGEDAAHGHGEEDQPPPVFVLDGDGIPQYYLAPYYLTDDGHMTSLASASPYSLTVDVGRTTQEETHMTLTALARGGSGKYEYEWALYPLVPTEHGFRFKRIGRGMDSSVNTIDGLPATASLQRVENGHYGVMLNVRDRATGAFKHFRQQVFSSPLSTAARSAQPVS